MKRDSDKVDRTQKYGSNWRMIHRMIHNIMNIKAAVTYVPYQDLENKFLLEGFLDTPEDVLAHLRRYTYSLSTQMIFGYRCVNNKDPNLVQLFKVRLFSPYPPSRPLLTTSRTLRIGQSLLGVPVLK